MLILDATNKSIKISTSNPVSSINPDFVASWADNNSTSFSEGSNEGSLNGTTEVVVIPSPATNTRRIIKTLSVVNLDNADVTFTVRYYIGLTSKIVAQVTLSPYERWTMEGSYDGSGNFKQVGNRGPTGPTGPGLGGTGTTGYIPKFLDGTDVTNSSISDDGALVTINSNTQINGLLYLNSNLQTGLSGGTPLVAATIPKASGSAAFFDYYTSNGTALRSGTVLSIWDSLGNAKYTDISSGDLNGSTEDLVLSVNILGSDVRLVASILSGVWSIKSSIRVL